MKNIGVIGGGINGLCAAWEMAKAGHKVTLYERGEIMQQTSRASSKMLHGGLRYLENYEFRLVRESLRERHWWLAQAPHLTEALEIFIPIYRHARRPKWMMQLGLMLYDFLAGSRKIEAYRSHSKKDFIAQNPEIKEQGLQGGLSYFDAQMDDYALGCWVAEQAQKAGVVILSNHEVARVTIHGEIFIAPSDAPIHHDLVFNVAGPWAEQLLKSSQLTPAFSLDAVRGSHIVFDQSLTQGYFLEVPKQRRVFFVLPYHGQTLVGTTERRQSIDEAIQVSDDEVDYLLSAYNHYFKDNKDQADIVHKFAGVRPLIRSTANPNKTSREYEIDQQAKLITVYGGKWTTAHALAMRLAKIAG